MWAPRLMAAADTTELKVALNEMKAAKAALEVTEIHLNLNSAPAS